LPEDALITVAHRRRRGVTDHPFARILTNRRVGAEFLAGFDAFAHPRHRCGHGVRVPWNRDLTGGRAGDDVWGLTGYAAEDGDPTGHERLELRRHGAFVGFERTETDESGIGPLPMGGQLRPCVLRIELDGNTVLSCHRL